MDRSRFLLLTVVLATVTAVALLGAGSALSDASAPAASTDADKTVIHRFYDAVNDLLRTGEPTGLDGVVAADLVTHDAFTGTVSGRAAFEDHLHALRAAYPLLQIVVDDVLVEEDRAIVRVSTRGADRGVFVGLPFDGTSSAWDAIDQIRLADGRVVERQGIGDPPARLQPLGSATFEAPIDAGVGVALERLTLAPGARAAGSSHHSSVMIAPEAGTLRFRVHGPVQVAPAAAGRAADTEPVATPAADLSVSTGDLVIFPGDAEFTMENTGETPAVALGVRVAAGVARPWSVLTKERIPGDQPLASGWPPGIAVERLADGLAGGLAPGQASVALGRATLAPGVAVEVGGGAGSALLVVETGTLGLESRDGTARVRRGVDGAISDVPSSSLAAGDRALVQAESATTLRNLGPEPLVVLLLSVVADGP